MRNELPMRRFSETFEVPFDTQADPFIVTVGRYDTGAIGEVFIRAAKRDQLFDHLARDTAVLISKLLQYGARLPDIASSLTRDADGRPQALAGAVIDAIVQAEN